MTRLEQAKQKYPYLFEKQICKICGKEFYYNNGQIIYIYQNLLKNKYNFVCCCLSHSAILKNKILGNPFSRRDIINKSRNTKKVRYGSETYNNREKCHKTKLSNIDENGLNSYDRVNNKLKLLNREKYNSDWFMGTDKFIQMSEKTKLEKYGDAHYVNIDRCVRTRKNDIDENGKNSYERAVDVYKKTNLNKYGVKFYTQTQECKKRVKQTWKNKNKNELEEINNKHIKTFNIKYGKDWFVQTKERNNLYKNKDYVRKTMLKQYKTKHINNSFHTSKPEELLFDLLKSKFPDTIHHYTDDSRYPFECDFYIPSEDLFIELNFHWTHGLEPFDKNNPRHQERLNLFKSKNTKFYKTAINVWTKRDILKLQTFKNNNLNYKIFYNKEQFNKWFENV